MYIATFHSESGDDYLLGPFDHEPTQDECRDLFHGYCPEEAEYSVDELGISFRIKKLPETPGVVSMQ